MIYLKGNFL